MELLLRRWAQAKAGNGRVVLISAEPGVGKSRLAEALAERIAAEPHTRLRYFCSPHHQDSALYPVIAQMERAAGFRARGRAGSQARQAAKHCSRASTPPPRTWPLIAELLSLPSADVAPPLDVTPQSKKEKTFEALLRQVEGLARQQPVLMMFDDIHWIDPSSRELLDRVIERMAHWPVLLLATFRPEFQPPWTGQPHVTTLTLGRLDRRETAAMVENVAGNALPTEIVEEIAERTDGVPLFVEELTKAVLEFGAQGTGALSLRRIRDCRCRRPLHASLMARLDRLGPAGAGHCAEGCCDRPRVQLRTACVDRRSAGAATSGGAGSADQLRPVVRARHGTAMRHTCSSTRWCRTRPTARSCAADGRTSSAHRRGARKRVPRDGQIAARIARTSSHRGGSGRARDRILEESRPTGARCAPR